MRSFGRIVLLVCFLPLPSGSVFAATTCAVAGPHPSSDAEKQLLSGAYAKAEGLYAADLVLHPGNVDSTVGFVRSLLREQKVAQAAQIVAEALKVAPASAAFISLRGEVELRQGLPWMAIQSADEALQRDPCLPRNLLLLARLDDLSSLYASGRTALIMAHQIDPTDPEILRNTGDPDARRKSFPTRVLPHSLARLE